MKHGAETLWPPRLVADLRQWLCRRYPDKDQNLLGVAANQIDGWCAMCCVPIAA